mgnify:CR=1 FL=1
MAYPYTGSSLDGRIAAGLSTAIHIEIGSQRVGAIQSFAPSQNRPITGIGEVGTDGFIEKVPTGPTDVKISVTRVVFDLLRLPQAFSRAFRNIHAQRVPFNIKEYDVSAVGFQQGGDGDLPIGDTTTPGILLTEYVDCWFSSLSATYQADNYLISETADIEVTYVNTIIAPGATTFRGFSEFGSDDNYERVADGQTGQKRVGSLDAVGLANALNGPLS